MPVSFNPADFMDISSASSPKQSAWRSLVDSIKNRDWGTTGKIIGDAAVRGAADIPGYVGDAVANPIRDIQNIPDQAEEIYRGLTGQGSKADAEAFVKRTNQPGVASGPINNEVDQMMGPSPTPQDATDRYLGAGVRGAVSMGPFAAEGAVPALLGGAGMGVGGQAGHDLFPNSPLAPILGSLLGGAAGGIPHALEGRANAARIIDGSKNPDFPTMVDITMDSESHGNRLAVSPKGARSEMQTMDGTNRDPGYGIRPSNGTLADDARVGRQYLAAMLSKYNHDPEKAWAAYNWGPGHLDHAIERFGDNWIDHAPEETRNYVNKNMNKLQGGSGVRPSALKVADNDYVDIPSDPEAAVQHYQDIVNTLAPEETAKVPDFDITMEKARNGEDLSDHEKSILNSSGIVQDPRSGTWMPRDKAYALGFEDWHENNFSDLPPVEESIIASGGGQQPPVEPPQNDYFEPEPPSGGNSGGDEPPEGPPEDYGYNPDPSYEGMDPEDKLLKALKEARPITAANKRLMHQERQATAAKLAKMQSEGGGLDSYRQQMDALKGQLPKVDFESFAKNFSQSDFNTLLNRINSSNSLLPYEKVSANTALLKLLGSEGAKIPTPGEIKLLSGVFGEDLIREMLNNRGKMAKFWDNLADGLNLPRAIMASADLSAPLRQGLLFAGRKEFYSSFVKMFHYFVSDKAFKQLTEEIHNDPHFGLMRQGGLAVGDNAFLSAHEEMFMTRLAGKLPLVKNSERAYTGFLWKLRKDTFNTIAQKYADMGIDLKQEPERVKSLSRFINTFTGKGKLPGKMQSAAPLLNSVFFAPQLIKARLDALANPLFYAEMDPLVRKEAVKALLSVGAIGATAIGLAKASGLSVEADPRSSDFGKIRIGNTRLDPWGGFQQYIHLGTQLVTSEKTDQNGNIKDLKSDKYGAESRGDVLVKFLRSKLAPIPSMVADNFFGKDVVGNKFNAKNEIVSRITPLVAQDIADVIKDQHTINNKEDLYNAVTDNGGKAAAVGVPAVFGVGLQTYSPRQTKNKEFAKTFSRENFAHNFASSFSAKDFK